MYIYVYTVSFLSLFQLINPGAQKKSGNKENLGTRKFLVPINYYTITELGTRNVPDLLIPMYFQGVSFPSYSFRISFTFALNSLRISFVCPFVFPLYVLCISYVFPLCFLCVSYVFLLYCLCISFACPLYFLCISFVFLYNSYVFPLYFLCISYVFPLYFLCVSSVFPSADSEILDGDEKGWAQVQVVPAAQE